MRFALKLFPLFALLFLTGCRKDPVAEPEPAPFTHIYGTAGDETGRQVRVLSNGDIVVCGYGAGPNGGSDLFLLRTDNAGNEKWRRYYGTAGDETCWTFDLAPGGGFVIGGWSNGAGSDDFFLVKTDDDGNEQWRKTYGSSLLPEQAIHVRALADGYLLSGIKNTGADENAFILRVNATGDSLWSFLFGGIGNDGAMYSCAGPNGSHVITGYTNSTLSGSTDGFLLLLSDSGTEINHYYFGTSEYDEPHAVQPAIDGNGWVITGHRGDAVDLTTHNVFLTAIASDGSQRWSYTYGGADHDGAEDMVVDGQTYGIIARSSSHVNYSQDLFFVQVNADGSLKDQRWLGTTAEDSGYGIAAEKYSFVVSGYTRGAAFGGKDIYLERIKKKN